MTKVGDQLDPVIPQPVNRLVGCAPIEAIGCGVGLIIRGPVTQSAHSHLANEREILTPAVVVPALLHLVDSAPIGKHGITVFNSS
jgi:hypothetical protein